MAVRRSIVLGVVADPMIYGLLDDVLSTQAFPVELYFDDVAAALQRTSAGDVAVVVLDLGWPEQEGLAFCEGLPSLPSEAQPPVIALTDHPADHWDVQGFSLGTFEVLTKPFHVADLLARVARYLPP